MEVYKATTKVTGHDVLIIFFILVILDSYEV